MKYPYLKGIVLVFAALAAAGPLVRGQTAPAPAEPAKAEDGETLVLSPFTVTSEDDQGYTATQTLAGTRLRTEMRDLGAAISVVTKQFLNDTGVTSNGTLLTYTTSSEVGGVTGNYSGFGNSRDISENRLNPQSTTRIRGLDDADNTRDYFLTDIPWDSYNVDRVDTVRGPNSILYGLGSPAGVVNTSLNEAGFKKKTIVETRFGRFGSYRAAIDANLVLLPQELAVRIDSVYASNKFRQKQAFNDDFRQYASLRYDPKALNNERMSTTFKASFEHGKILANNPTNSPPVDSISPWFDPNAGNKFKTEPFMTWSSTFDPATGTFGPVWTPGGIRNDGNPSSDSGFRTGGGQSVLPGGAGANPAWNPWLGTGGYQGGVTFVSGYGATAPNGVTFVQPKISIGSNVSALGGGIEGIPYSQHNGVTDFASFATRVRMPGYQTGLYKQRYITDTTVFDYYNNLIGGDNSRQWQNWKVFNVSAAQTFLAGRVGYEVVYHEERYDNGQWSLYGGNSAIQIETDTHNGDGSVNPNFGKPYIVSNGRYGNFSNDIRREDVRVTGFGELRGSDIFEADSWAARFVGKQRFTGLYTTDDKFQEKKEWMLYAADPTYTQYTMSNGAAYDIENSGVNVVAFLGGNMYDTASLSGANLTAAGKMNVPTDGSIKQFIPKWNAPATVDPSGAWTPTPTGLPGSINSHNPANYQGYTIVPVHVYSAFNPAEKEGMYVGSGNQKSNVKVTSKAGIWQGYFADGLIVPLFGIRKDTVRTAYKTPVRRTNNSYDLSDPSYVLGTANVESGTTKTYSVVLHAPRRLKESLPFGMDVGLYYNQSKNFRPGAGRVDIYGDPLANPNGSTKDIGIIMSFLDEKISVKLNKFEMDLKNANSSINVSYIGHSLRRDWAFQERYRTGYGEDWQHVYTPWAGQTQEQADALKNGAIAALQTFIQDPDVKKLYEVWDVTKGDPNSYKTDQWNATVPNGVAAVQDTKSKGYELEVSANLTRNWTLTANVTKTKATVENVGGTALVDFVKKYHDALQGPMGEIRYWWGGSDALARNEFNNNFYGSWSQATIGAGADVSELRPWHVNVISTYRFSEGRLKGLMAGGAVRWASRPIIGYPTTLDSTGTFHFDLEKPWKGTQEPGLDFWVGYDFKARANTKWHVQLNVRNALGRDTLVPVSVQYDGGKAAFRIPEPVGWEITSRLEF